jgi:hypothetical protein
VCGDAFSMEKIVTELRQLKCEAFESNFMCLRVWAAGRLRDVYTLTARRRQLVNGVPAAFFR